ncbi:MAG: hypothetical protein LBH21_08565 [Gracilibacteraceae bacterium]|jgi:hypothetical protein|nr:hypothetical protein [Gracilibacteraceae bacterium]
MAILAVYDATGIQDYVFESGKLSECRGASLLVRSVFREILPQSLRALSAGSLTDWENKTDTPLCHGAPAEIVSAGGGNAYVVYENEDRFQAGTEKFLRAVFEKTHGVGIAAAAIETDLADFPSDYEKLQTKLAETKGAPTAVRLAGSQHITRVSTLTGAPVTRVGQYHGQWENLGEGQYRKRDQDARTGGGRELDDLGESDNNFIGLIHADGNDMSSRIRATARKERSWERAVPKLRRMAKNISAYFKEAYKLTVEAYQASFSPGEQVPPIISLVSDGEDMTFFVRGKYAVSFAAAYLRNVERLNDDKNLAPFADGRKITACAGVTLFHSHFPVAAAYKMTEELCANAKSLARRAQKEQKQELSFLDFHLAASGFITGVGEFRSAYYPATNLGRLYLRPLCASEYVPPHWNTYDGFVALLQELRRDPEKYPRSKLKDIRPALVRNLGESFPLAEAAIGKLGLEPAQREDNGYVSTHKYAALNDALEFMDIFENILGGPAYEK